MTTETDRLMMGLTAGTVPGGFGLVLVMAAESGAVPIEMGWAGFVLMLTGLAMGAVAVIRYTVRNRR